jgi:hypothetical protein
MFALSLRGTGDSSLRLSTIGAWKFGIESCCPTPAGPSAPTPDSRYVVLHYSDTNRANALY